MQVQIPSWCMEFCKFSHVSLPQILQRPAPLPGALFFGAPLPERPSAPANPEEQGQRECRVKEKKRIGRRVVI